MAQLPEVHAPAAAYYEVARLLSPWYFLHPPPVEGMELVLEGVQDRVRTHWLLGAMKAEWLLSMLRGSSVRVIGAYPYQARK